jgi:hypothetical protein
MHPWSLVSSVSTNKRRELFHCVCSTLASFYQLRQPRSSFFLDHQRLPDIEMDKSPVEIISSILSHLDSPLAPYSTISRDWQCLIEARTMAEIHVRSDDASQLDLIFQHARRRSLLKSLSYEIILPSYSVVRWSKLPSRRECRENNAVFTRELRNLFRKLHAHDKENSSIPFCLKLGVSSPSDSWRGHDKDEGTGEDRNNNTYIYLDPAEQEPLPVLTKVIGFEKYYQRYLHPSILGLVLRSLPALEKIVWDFMGPDVRLLDLRRDIRTCELS